MTDTKFVQVSYIVQRNQVATITSHLLIDCCDKEKAYSVHILDNCHAYVFEIKQTESN